MRTTVTIDGDVEQLLKKSMRRTNRSFKQTLNDAVRSALKNGPNAGRATKFKVNARPMGVIPGLDPAKLSEIDTDLEIEEFKKKTSQLEQRTK